jgi:hypothetical protein
MEPRLVNLIFALLQSITDGRYIFPYYPLEDIRDEALLVADPYTIQPHDDVRKQDSFQSALNVFFNPPEGEYPTFSFPDCDVLQLGVDNASLAYAACRRRFSGHLVALRDQTERTHDLPYGPPGNSRVWAPLADHDRRLQDFVYTCLNLTYIQERALGDLFVISYGKDVLSGVRRYNSITARGPFPFAHQGNLHIRIHALLCNLVGVLPRNFFWPVPATTLVPHPDDSWFDQSRYEYQFSLRLKLRAALAEAEFCADNILLYPDVALWIATEEAYDIVDRFI